MPERDFDAYVKKAKEERLATKGEPEVEPEEVEEPSADPDNEETKTGEEEENIEEE